MLIGYARVSTRDQETHLQMDALHRAGVGHLMCFFACPRASLSGQFRAGQLGAIRGACTVTALHASSRAGKRRALLLA